MAASKVPILYDQTTGQVLGWVVFDEPQENDSHLAGVRAFPGQAILLIERSRYGDLPALQALVDDHLKGAS